MPVEERIITIEDTRELVVEHRNVVHMVYSSERQGLAIFALTWLLTAGALAGLHVLVSAPSTALATLAVALAAGASTGLRFVAMRSWMFRSAPQYT